MCSLFFSKNIYNIYNKFYAIPTKVNICKSNMYRNYDTLNQITDLLAKKGNAYKTYIAAKGICAETGLSYFLLINYESNSELITYSYIGGLIVENLSKSEGEKLFKDIIGSHYHMASNYYGGSISNSGCDFIRLNDSINQYDIQLINAKFTTDNISNKILFHIKSYLNKERKSSKILSAKGPEETNTLELRKFEELVNEDLFFELSTLKEKN